MERCRAIGSSTRDEDLDARLASIRRPPFRLLLRHEPPEAPDGHPTLLLQPTTPVAAVRSLAAVMPATASLLLVDALVRRRTRRGRVERRPLADEARVSDSLLVDPVGLRERLTRLGDRATVAVVEGPIDSGDAAALECALRHATPPIDADIRTCAVLQIEPDGAIWSQWRDLTSARRFGAALLARYIAAAAELDSSTTESQAELGADALRNLLPAVTGERCVRPCDVRCDDDSVIARVRSSGGATLRVVLDRTIGRWLPIQTARHDSRA